MDNQQATLAELGWLAGIIDGEGWLGMTVCNDRRRVNGLQVKPELKINNCDEEIISKTYLILRKLGINPYRRSMKVPGIHRMVYEVATKNMTNLIKVISPVYPYLTGNKQMRAKVMLEFMELRKNNPGIPNPAYNNGAKGKHGSKTIRPYNARELELIELCRDLQSRGASETTRRKRDMAVEALKKQDCRLNAMI